jgi:hypothetical protein
VAPSWLTRVAKLCRWINAASLLVSATRKAVRIYMVELQVVLRNGNRLVALHRAPWNLESK